MTKLINIRELAAFAETRGFKVICNTNSAELWFPENNGATGVWHDGSLYSTADIVLTSLPAGDYGCNEAYYGPYHYGYAHADSFGVKKLLSHVGWLG